MKYLLLFCLAALAIACKKRVLEIVPVIEIEKDMSIVNAGDIKHFSFPSGSVGYAASDTNFIYKTTDGGASWKVINPGGGTCRGIEFFDDTHGMCLMGSAVMVTGDGGQSWTPADYADFIGITGDGVAVSGSCGFPDCNIRVSTDSAKSFTSLGSVEIDGDFTRARVVDGKVIVFAEETYYDDVARGLDISTGEDYSVSFDNITASQNPEDIYLYKGEGAVVAPAGTILTGSNGHFNRDYYGHLYSYYSADGYEGFIICVGENTITTNLDVENSEPWTEVLDTEGNGFDRTFYRIRLIAGTTFYLSGSDGYLVKAKI